MKQRPRRQRNTSEIAMLRTNLHITCVLAGLATLAWVWMILPNQVFTPWYDPISDFAIACTACAALGWVLVVISAFQRDRACRCRNCGYILRGLSEPRCPECGEAI